MPTGASSLPSPALDAHWPPLEARPMITDPHACKAHSGLRESRHDARRGSGLPGDIGQRGPWDPPGVTAPLVGMGDRAGSTLRLHGCHSPSPQWNHHPEQSRVVARRHCRNRPSGTVRTPRDGGDHARRFPICTSPPVRLLPLPARSPGPLDPGRPRSCAAPTEVGAAPHPVGYGRIYRMLLRRPRRPPRSVPVCHRSPGGNRARSVAVGRRWDHRSGRGPRPGRRARPRNGGTARSTGTRQLSRRRPGCHNPSLHW
jgi:hypothetical protein